MAVEVQASHNVTVDRITDRTAAGSALQVELCDPSFAVRAELSGGRFDAFPASLRAWHPFQSRDIVLGKMLADSEFEFGRLARLAVSKWIRCAISRPCRFSSSRSHTRAASIRDLSKRTESAT